MKIETIKPKQLKVVLGLLRFTPVRYEIVTACKYERGKVYIWREPRYKAGKLRKVYTQSES